MLAQPRQLTKSRSRASRADSSSTSSAQCVLRARVHWDGFRLSPSRYIEAIFWRLVGKRLRAKNRLSELNGQSPLAYNLWIRAIEPAAISALPASFPNPKPAILVLIDQAYDQHQFAITKSSVLASDPDADVRVALPEGFDGWVLALKAGDLVAQQTLPAYAGAVMRHEDATVFYADDDLIDRSGQRHAPHFKPDWNPALFEHHDYLTHSALYRRPRAMVDRSDPLAEIIRATAGETQVPPVHLPFVLHHRRCRPMPTIPRVDLPRSNGPYPHVTVLVPTRDRVDLLRDCINGLSRTDYPRFDCIVIDNDSRESITREYLDALPSPRFSVLRYPGAFNFSAMNNAAARIAEGDLLCFLNNDIEFVDPSWMRVMVEQATRADCGAVGAKLLYPDGTIQHAGVVTGIGGGAAHVHRLLGPEDEGYFRRADLPQQITAVTAACMIVDKGKFLAVGGFNADHFPVAFNDVDLCLKLNSRGWQSFYEPRAVLVHHESKSRGDDRAAANRVRFAGELAALKRIWGTDAHLDPYHHPQLSRFSTSFVVAI